MASLPTAYASQRFGRKSLDYYAAAGDVIGADPRARADERRLQDLEGARHTLRLMERGFRLDPGDHASVLRMQPGPARRSRPVAVVNHTTGAWSRTHPGVTGLLARAGIARALNWALTLGLFALAALAIVWPYLRTFLVEIDPSTFSRAPQFDVFALTAAAIPGLADWRLADMLAPFTASIQQLAPMLAGLESTIAFGVAAFLAAIMVYTLRSWRLIWAPLFVGAAGAGALGFDGAAGAVGPALGALAIGVAVFILGGVINRVRDAARLERRIAVLADHVLRNAPEEMVAGAVEPDSERYEDVGPAAAMAASAYRSGDDLDNPEAEVIPSEPGADADETDESHTETAVEPEQETETDAAADAAPQGDGENEGDAVVATAESAQPGEPASEAGITAQTPASSDTSDEAHAENPDAPDAPAHDPVEAQGETAPSAEDAVDPDAPSDVPNRDADSEQPSTFEQDETERLRTDPRYAARAIVLPPPPPMPGAAQAEPQAEPGDGDGAAEAASAPNHAPTTTRTLRPGAPLPHNVVPMFAAPTPKRTQDEPVD